MKVIKQLSALPKREKLKVAAYTRVSHHHLLNSLSNQVSYYNQLIQNHPDWEYVGVYSDDVVSGKQIKNRKNYLKLLDDCRHGKVDMILTKSISRFGRNTIELLETIRELKQLGISVRFEKESIDTLTTDGELLITLLATLAEEESNQISSNIRWKVRKKFEQGIPHNPQPILGYRWKDDHYDIYESEAMLVRKIYDDYISGITPSKIANRLNEDGFTTRKGNSFTRSIIHNILNQEAYTGILILQKTYRRRGKSRSIPNEGALNKYIVEAAHEPIVAKSIFEKVQELKQKNNLRKGKKND
ncbi:recombinase family protein [Carnobacteriaceae bacterium zg-84]|uniref:recombinase family protein n=1 Tax=Granulicatella sp. zg-84 TaxID=2678503 RepID=UPI0013C08BC4|nr:recombinase family protein [Granulicatella sp. zg-84]NEW66027.1 recombinase family protein [Granulicatella sp. zg-84]QMI86560.1 recombinase family protein [Carnobacteriaceae bacterium zg-84]